VGSTALVETQVRVRGRDGKHRWHLFRAQPLSDSSGEVVKWCGLGTDIDAQVIATEKAKPAPKAETVPAVGEDDSRLILDNIPGIVLFIKPDGELEFANSVVTNYFGKSLEELSRWAEDDTIHPEDRPHIVEIFKQAIASGKPYKFEGRFRSFDGTYRWFKCRGLPSRDAEGRIVRWRAVGIDIEDQKRAEALLAGEKQLLEMVASDRPLSDILETLCRHVESTASGSYCSIVLVDSKGAKLQEAIAPSLPAEFNDAVRGWPLERLGGPCQVAARDKVQVIMPDVMSDARWRTSWRKLAQKHGLTSCWSTPMVSRDGKVLGTIALYQREPGTPSARQLKLIEQFTSIASIAIERAQRDDALRQSELGLRSVIDGIPGLVAVLAPDGQVEAVNQRIIEYCGRSLEELKSWGTNGTVHEEDLPHVADVFGRSIASGVPYEIEQRLRRFDGTYLWFDNRGIPIRDEAGRIVRWYVLLTNIDQRKRAEEALRESERNARLMIDSIPGQVAIFTPDGEFEFVNRQILEYAGTTLDDVVSRHLRTRDTLHPEDHPRATELFKQSMVSGESFEFEVRIRRFDGAYRWFQSRGLPLRDKNGRIVRWYNLLIDIDERKRAEEALRRSEAQLADAKQELQLTIDTIPTLIASYWPNGERDFVSKNWQEYTGISQEEARGKNSAITFHPDRRDVGETMWQACLASGEPYEADERLRRADGEYRWHWIRRVPLRDESGKIIKWYGVGHDIEHQKQAEEALRRSETQLREAQRELQLTIDSIPAMVATYEPDGTRTFVNQQWQNYTRRSSEEATGSGRHIMRQFHPDESERVERAFWNSLATGEPLTLDLRIRRADGEYRWHTHQSVPVRDEQGTILKWYATEVDIEDKKRAESALLHSEARLAETERELRVTLDSIPTITWRAGPNGYVQQLNKRWFEYTGTTPEQVRGWRWKLCVHPDDLDHLVEIGTQYVTTGMSIDCEARLRRHDGEYRWFLFRPAPARDESGKLVAWYGSITDIEDRKQAEQKALEAEREVQHMLDSIPAMIVRGGANGYIHYFSRQWFDYTGTTLETQRGSRWWETLHPDDKDRLVEFGARFVADGVTADCEARLRRFDGTYRWFLFRPAAARDDAGNFVGWYGTVTDIEDQKRAEQALAGSEHNLKLIIDTIPALAWAARLDGSAEFCNQNYAAYTGLSLEELQGWGYSTALHPDDVDETGRKWQAILASGRSGETEARMRRRDGQYRWFMFRAAPLRDEDGRPVKWYGIGYDIEDRKRAEEELRRSETFLAEGQRISSTGTFSWRVDTDELKFSEELSRIFELDPNVVVTFEQVFARIHPEDRPALSDRMNLVRSGRGPAEQDIRLLMPDRSIKYLRSVGQMIHHRDGRPEYLGAIQDITPRRRTEEALDKVRSELARVTRVMSLSALTASIAHEVNQPLAGIITNASTCLRMLGADPPNVDGARETARRTIRDGNRAADVIARLRALFSKKAAAPEAMDLNEATREVVQLVFSDLLRNKVVIRAELDNDHPLLVMGDRVQIQQVILNLVRNASDAMSGVDGRPRELLIRTDTDEEQRARLSVKDAGTGIEPQALERLFDAFYTTKSDGMGIGLSVSRSIIESHGGKLWAEANDGPGATFAFSIPLQATSAGDEAADGVNWKRPTRGAHDVMRNAE
jgi:PAS domain S-box-containing protein